MLPLLMLQASVLKGRDDTDMMCLTEAAHHMNLGKQRVSVSREGLRRKERYRLCRLNANKDIERSTSYPKMLVTYAVSDAMA